MEISNMVVQLLENMERPGFIACGGKVIYANERAKKQHILPDTALSALLTDHSSQYEAFTEGQMQLTLAVGDFHHAATLQRIDGCDLFILEHKEHPGALQALAMAAQQLREPLTGLMVNIGQDDPVVSRSLHRLHRAISNMSDAMRYRIQQQPRLQLTDVPAFVDSVMESVIAREDSLNTKIQYTSLPKTVMAMVDEELLERAILNLISNSVKAGSRNIQVSLTEGTNTLMFTVKDNGSGVSTYMRSQMFSHFDREPALEDYSYGLGLGMLIVQAAASAHKGTVLMEHGMDGGLKVTMTISLTKTEKSVRSPAIRIDYLGGRDHVLTELSDTLSEKEF